MLISDNFIARCIFSVPIVKTVWCKVAPYIPLSQPRFPRGSLKTIQWGSASPQIKDSLPRIIWSYWEGPASVCGDACSRSWVSNSKGFEIRIVDEQSLPYYLPEFPAVPNDVPVQLKSDLVRLLLLEEYGGVWIDYSVLLTQPLQWVVDVLNDSDADIFAFYNEIPGEYKRDRSRPIIENGFIAAKRGCEFISRWRMYHQECILSGGWKGYYRTLPNYQQLVRNFSHADEDLIDYLACYISAQRTMLELSANKLVLVDACSEYYSLRYGLSKPFRSVKIAQFLLLSSSVDVELLPKIIKLTGGNRRLLDEYIKYKCYKRHSLLGKYIH